MTYVFIIYSEFQTTEVPVLEVCIIISFPLAYLIDDDFDDQ